MKNEDSNSNERIYFPELDGLRFFAFLLVFIHHHSFFTIVPHFGFLHNYGWIGVDLFFVLSSFLFTKLLIAQYNKTNTISFKKFYMRRIFRIWPIYYLFIGSIVLFIFIREGTISKEICNRFIGLCTFSDNIVSAYKGYNPIPCTFHLWTIGYEEQFYIFIPIIIFLLVRSSFKVKLVSSITIFIIFNIIRYILIANKTPHPAIWVLPITHFESIFMGIIIGFGGINFLLKKNNPLVLGIISILLFLLLTRLPNVTNISYWLIVLYTLVGISTSLLLFSVLNSNFLKNIFSLKIFVFLGKRSYGLYVYHIIGISITEVVIKNIPEIPSSLLASFLYSLFFTIFISIVSYKIIEKPFLKWKKKFEIIISRPV